jgi:hypothetical protein
VAYCATGADLLPVVDPEHHSRRSLVTTEYSSVDAYRFSPEHAGLSTKDHFVGGMVVNGRGRRRSLVSAANFNQATTASRGAPKNMATWAGANAADHLDNALNVVRIPGSIRHRMSTPPLPSPPQHSHQHQHQQLMNNKCQTESNTTHNTTNTQHTFSAASLHRHC